MTAASGPRSSRPSASPRCVAVGRRRPGHLRARPRPRRSAGPLRRQRRTAITATPRRWATRSATPASRVARRDPRARRADGAEQAARPGRRPAGRVRRRRRRLRAGRADVGRRPRSSRSGQAAYDAYVAQAQDELGRSRSPSDYAGWSAANAARSPTAGDRPSTDARRADRHERDAGRRRRRAEAARPTTSRSGTVSLVDPGRRHRGRARASACVVARGDRPRRRPGAGRSPRRSPRVT